jgi:putative restriction endonuclease
MERGLYNDSGNISGRAQAAVRPISESDFNRILDAGLSNSDTPLPRIDQTNLNVLHLEEGQAVFEYKVSRERQILSGSLAIRSPIFRKLVLNAYDERCAFTGLKFINGGGRAEVEAAHIRAVEHNGPDSIHNGPDSIQNGIALSGTVHWMFDRGLLSLADDMEIMVSRHVNDTASLEKLIHNSFKATLPDNQRNAPHPAFLRWHRQNCFKV